jgi:anti-sigma factor RsiW
MDCRQFHEALSNYLEGALPSAQRAQCAAHRLRCLPCRELYQDVESILTVLRDADPVLLPEIPLSVTERILAATSMGMMTSCPGFDRLIDQYFDGVLLAPAYHALHDHLAHCPSCRRLILGIESAISSCQEVQRSEVTPPIGWEDRLVEATRPATPLPRSPVGPEKKKVLPQSHRRIGQLFSPDIAAALLILAASSLFVLVRFGSVEGLAIHAGTQAEQWVNQSQESLVQLQRLSRKMSERIQAERSLSTPPQSTLPPEE